MKSSIKRTLKSRQIGQVQTFHLISGTAGTPADSGIDKAFVASVADLGAGSYKITFIEPSRLNIAAVAIVPVTAERIMSVSAVDKESITIRAEDAAGAQADADFYLSCLHSTLLDTVF